jgi:L-malate glycosyltransferase
VAWIRLEFGKIGYIKNKKINFLKKTPVNFLTRYFKYPHFITKRKIENIFISPFIVLGRLIAALNPLKKEYEMFFFFPFYHVGGAEKVHAQIAQATGGENCIIFFTRKSQNNLFYQEFKKSGCDIKDISKLTDNKLVYFLNLIYRGIISYYINRQKKRPLVFNGQCNFGYKISPWIKKQIPQIELIHSLGSFSYIRIPFIEYYYRTVMISKERIADHIKLYNHFHIPTRFSRNIVFILNAIPLPAKTKTYLNPSNPLRILYSGRTDPEKRVHLVAMIAKEVKESEKLNVDFIFLGDVEKAIPNELHKYCSFLGYHSDPDFINQTYLQSDVLIIVSDAEGFPMVVMEAMAAGLAIIATAVGEIPLHVKNNVNGFLIYDVNDEAFVIKQAVKHIKTLYNNPGLLMNIGESNKQHAVAHFGLNRFESEYRSLFDQARKDFDIQ